LRDFSPSTVEEVQGDGPALVGGEAGRRGEVGTASTVSGGRGRRDGAVEVVI
jgi:hypothetical protein